MADERNAMPTFLSDGFAESRAGPTGPSGQPGFPVGPNGTTGPTKPLVEHEQGPSGDHVALSANVQIALEGVAGLTPSVAPSGPPAGPDTFYSPQVSVTETVKMGMSTDAEVVRAPFSEIGVAERLAQNPEFYRQLMLFAAAALRKQAESYPVHAGQGNSAAVIKGEMNAEADRYERAAVALDSEASDRFATAAKIVIEIRDQIVGFAENHPELTRVFFELSGVVAGCFALTHIGVSPELSGLISAAVVKREKLSEVIGAWRGNKNENK